MVLSDQDIEQALASGRITVTPALDTSTQLGSCSVDFRLGHAFRIFAHTKYPYIDPQDAKLMTEVMEEVTVPDGEAFIMRPGEFVLATTMEHLSLPDDLVARVEGRSSLGRIGIIVHGTASIFDPGWVGIPVLELGNLGMMPVALRPGMRICSFTFEELTSPAKVPYTKKKSAKYVNQMGPEASRFARESVSKRK
jgi:dCTP deaminase